MRWLRLAGTVAVLGVLTILLMPLQLLATRKNWPVAAKLPFYWQRIACRLIGVRVTVIGKPAAPPLLIAMNHVSWLDIPVVSSVLPVSFVAKAEVATWPIVKTLARLQRTIFVDRTRRAKTGEVTEVIGRRIGRGDNIVLFAEGTTGDGNRVLPFRSALLGAAGAVAGGTPIHVQPVAVAYMRVHGLPVSRPDRPEIAWYGAMDMTPHFVHLASLGAIDVTVTFGEPIAFGPEADRKKVAEDCYAAVRRMIDDARRAAMQKGNRSRLFSREPKGAKAAPAGAESQSQPIANRIS